jgi:hypothetical protein
MNAKLLSQGLKGKFCLGELGVVGRMALRWILNKEEMRVWIGFIWLKIRTSGGIL